MERTNELNENVIKCQITGRVLEAANALEYKIKGVPHFVDPNAVLELVQSSSLFNVILERIALNQGTFNEILSIRKQAAALEKGKQDGANLAIDALRKTAKESGIEPTVLEDLIQKTFNQAQSTDTQTVQDSVAEEEVQ